MVAEQYKPCGRCQGKGRILAPKPTDRMRNAVVVSCPACGGSGKRLVWR